MDNKAKSTRSANNSDNIRALLLPSIYRFFFLRGGEGGGGKKGFVVLRSDILLKMQEKDKTFEIKKSPQKDRP